MTVFIRDRPSSLTIVHFKFHSYKEYNRQIIQMLQKIFLLPEQDFAQNNHRQKAKQNFTESRLSQN